MGVLGFASRFIMSPSPSAPYQSKLLRTMLRQTQRWADRSKGLWRQAKVAATWSAQILLYPIYAFFQASRLLGTRMYQESQLRDLASRDAVDAPERVMGGVPAPEPSMLQVDTPIRRVLATVQTLALSDPLPVLLDPPAVGLVAGTVTLLGTASQTGLTIRGIASCLTTRAIVLVTPQNGLLDILTPSQQTQLRDRMMAATEVDHPGLPQAMPAPLSAQSLLARLGQVWQQGRQWLRQRWHTLETNPAAPLALSSHATIGQPNQAIQQTLQAVGQMVIAPDRVAPLMTDASLVAASQAVYIRGIATLLDNRSQQHKPQTLVLVTSENVLLDILTPAQQDRLRQRLAWEIAHYRRYWELRQMTARVFEPIAPAPATTPVFSLVRRFQQLMAWVQASPVAITTNLFQEAQQMLTLNPAIPALATDPMALPDPWSQDMGGGRSSLHNSDWSHWVSQLKQPMAYLSGLPLPAIGSQRDEFWRLPQRFLPAATITPASVATVAHTWLTYLQGKLQELRQLVSQPLALPREMPRSGGPVILPPEPLIAETLSSRQMPATDGEVSVTSLEAPVPLEQTSWSAVRSHLDYIEIQATLIEYLQSPAERVLRWLDRLLVWLEDVLLIIGQFVWRQILRFYAWQRSAKGHPKDQ